MNALCRRVCTWAVTLSVFVLTLTALSPSLSFGQGCSANFTAAPTSGCEGLTVTFTDASSGATSWTWSFPGGSPSSADGKGPHKVVYKTAGLFDAALAIKCKAGATSEYKKGLIHVSDCSCVAEFSAAPTSGCAGLEVVYTDHSTGAVAWIWDFPGGTPSNAEGKGPHKVVYKTIGAYDASLEIKCDNNGDKESKKALIQIVDCNCQADFTATPTSGVAPLSVLFTDRSSHAVNWVWSFPGGEPSSMQGRGPHTVVYQNPGDYDVSLQITCSNGQDLLQIEDYIHVQAVDVLGDYGDAPEGRIAYPSTGVVGAFPTCRSSGSAGYIRHRGNKGSFLGNKVDHETEGNAGSCSSGRLYDQDELCYEADAGLWAPDAFTLRDSAGVIQVVPLCAEFDGTALGEPCETARWGRNINLWYDSDHVAGGAFVNVLIDWNQDGRWGGSSVCTDAPAPRWAEEHILKNFALPGGANGHISLWNPPDFLIGPNTGYVWCRMTITETPVPLPWDGSGDFNEGESEDYLLKIVEENRLFDYGDAPFLTRLADNGAQHRMFQNIYLGSGIDPEPDGQADAQALGDDRNGRDDEDGVEFHSGWVIGDTARIAVTASAGGMLKAWVDFNQDRDWDDKGEMVLDTQVAAGTNPLRIFIPADAKEDSTFARFRFSSQAIPGPTGLLMDGEVEDYRIFLGESLTACEKDSLALVALYRSTNGSEWTNHSNWLTGPLSTWYGVELDSCRVSVLRLQKNNLTGALPAEIGDLTAMRILDLSNLTFFDSTSNQIGGTLPRELGQCAACVEMNLSLNHFTGTIPLELGDLPSLQKLSIDACDLSGAIPPELGRLSHLTELSLSHNHLEGEMPVALCNLSHLSYLALHDNQLTGTIPAEISRLSNLRSLYISNNMLSGPFPAAVCDLPLLNHLSLQQNGFTGTIPPDIGDLVNLNTLGLDENQFEGELPTEIYSLTNLVFLGLRVNQFSGEIPSAIGALTNLRILWLGNNHFSGAFPEEITRLTNLLLLEMRSTRIEDFPNVAAMPSLKALFVESNRLTFGDIEPNMGIENYTYAPQDSLGTERDTTLIAGRPFQLHVEVDGTANQYQWQRNGVDLPARNTATLTVLAVSAADTGSYVCRITSSMAVDLTLYTRPVHLYLEGATEVQVPPAVLPDHYALEQNYPNPFNPETRIVYQLPRPSRVWLGIYNLRGQCIRLLVNEEQEAGLRSVIWDGCDDHGAKKSSDIYFYRIKADDFSAVRKMVLLQ